MNIYTYIYKAVKQSLDSPARILELFAISFSRVYSQHRDRTCVLWVSCTAGGSWPLSHQGSQIYICMALFLDSFSVYSFSNIILSWFVELFNKSWNQVVYTLKLFLGQAKYKDCHGSSITLKLVVFSLCSVGQLPLRETVTSPESQS